MNNYLLYLTGSGLCLGLFYLTYWTLLRNKTTHRFCRFYLISVVIIALIIPVINISINNLSSNTKSNKTIIKIADTKNNYERLLQTNKRAPFFADSKFKSAVPLTVKPVTSGDQENTYKTSFLRNMNLLQWFLLIYLLGSAYFLLSLLVQLVHIWLLIRNHMVVKEGNIKFVLIEKEMAPFSFFNYIFINQNNYSPIDYQKIIEHEKIHIKEHHTLDVLIVELLLIIQWVNPFIWFIKDSLKKTHEYLADKGVLSLGHDIQAYQTLLLQQLIYPTSFRLTNAFNFKPIKKRLAMMTKIQISTNNKYQLLKLLPVFIITCIAIAIGVIISCTNSKTQHYNIVEIKGNGKNYNYSKLWGYMLPSDSVHASAMLVEQGDLLVLGENYITLYQQMQEKAINYKESKSLFFVNGKINSIKISDDIDLLAWFKQMKSSDISDLQALIISSDKISESYYPYLKEIAKTKPDIGFCFDKNCDTRELFKIFSPTWLVGLRISKDEINNLSGLKNLEVLGIELGDSLTTASLPYLPKLKQVLITDSKNDLSGIDFFKNNPHIERLMVTGKMDLSFIKSLKDLKELSVLGGNEFMNVDFLKEFKKLEVLRFVGGGYKNINAINELPNLRWLALPSTTSQAAFNLIIEHHPNLEMLEMLKCDSVKSLKSLLQLDNLYGLVFTDTVPDNTTLRSLKNLKYLSITEETYNDSIKTASLRQSLPGCTIVPNEGFCLGSGWLLLLIPFIILFRICMRNKKSGAFNCQ